jgi:hypothetical protein
LPHVATWQIVTTILPLIVLLMVMYAGLAFGWWPLLALGVPAAALTARHGDRTEAEMISSHHDTGFPFCIEDPTWPWRKGTLSTLPLRCSKNLEPNQFQVRVNCLANVSEQYSEAWWRIAFMSVTLLPRAPWAFRQVPIA